MFMNVTSMCAEMFIDVKAMILYLYIKAFRGKVTSVTSLSSH